MSNNDSQWCVFLPCSKEEIWAIPQKCLAEIVTLQEVGEVPPEVISWRGQDVPVLDIDEKGEAHWRDLRGETGRIAVILGLKGEGYDYWAVALRGDGLSVRNISTEQILDLPDGKLERSTAAFELQNVVYQVPDLQELQKQAGMSCAAA
ncbi:MAG: chemotaxis protein CheW [Halioglobus sp.]